MTKEAILTLVGNLPDDTNWLTLYDTITAVKSNCRVTATFTIEIDNKEVDRIKSEICLDDILLKAAKIRSQRNG